MADLGVEVVPYSIAVAGGLGGHSLPLPAFHGLIPVTVMNGNAVGYAPVESYGHSLTRSHGFSPEKSPSACPCGSG